VNQPHAHRGQPCALRPATLAALAARACCALVVVLAALPPVAWALDADPDDYVAFPSGSDVALLYFQHVERNSLYAHGARQAGGGLDSDTAILRYSHLETVGGLLIDPQVLLPLGNLRTTGPAAAPASVAGMGDLILCMTTWFINDEKTSSYLGVTPFLFVPTGSYRSERALNWGENRWKLTLQGGYQWGMGGKFSAVTIADATFYGSNTDLGPAHATLRQQVSYHGQFYLRFTASEKIDSYLGVSYTTGGTSQVNGVSQDDRQRESKFIAGGGYFFNPGLEKLAGFGHDLSMANGYRESRRINLRLMKVL
jgi:hypothetical protein